MKRQREFSCFYSDNEPLLRRRASTIGGGSTSLFCSPAPANVDGQDGDAPDIDHAETEKDTIRVRIWRALASGDEVSMTQLCKRVGERRGDVRSHLKHVERQANWHALRSAVFICSSSSANCKEEMGGETKGTKFSTNNNTRFHIAIFVSLNSDCRSAQVHLYLLPLGLLLFRSQSPALSPAPAPALAPV